LTDELTDPAHELTGMARWILNLPASPAALGAHFSARLGLDVGSAEYITLLTESRVRLDRMERFASKIDDKDFDELQRNQVVQACARLRGFFHPMAQHQSFDQMRANHVQPADALALSWFSHVARRHRPLRRITEDERNNAIASIDEALKNIADDTELPEWAKPILLDGLARIRLTIRFLPFFGHDAAFDALLLLDQQNQGIMEALKAHAISGSQAVLDIAKVIATVVALFNAPVTMHNSYVEYRGVLTKALSAHHQPLSLPKPPEPSKVDKPKSKIDSNITANV
jgi:hypothetical protein